MLLVKFMKKLSCITFFIKTCKKFNKSKLAAVVIEQYTAERKKKHQRNNIEHCKLENVEFICIQVFVMQKRAAFYLLAIRLRFCLPTRVYYSVWVGVGGIIEQSTLRSKFPIVNFS